MTLKLRLFKHLFSQLENGVISEAELAIYEGLESQMFDWISAASPQLATSPVWDLWLRRGLVISTRDMYFPLALHLIRSVRRFGCLLPIVVYHLEPGDLSLPAIRILQGMENAKVVNIEQRLNITKVELHKGWDIKPFAMLLAPFTEVILLDVVFMQSPEEVFADPGYRETGALYFPDRTMLFDPPANQAWINKTFLPPFSSFTLSSRFYHDKTAYEIESGVVLIDKSRHFFGLLATCLLNVKEARKVLHEKTHGEKESFWLGFDLAQEPFSLLPVPAGIISNSKNKDALVCGKLAHFDRQGRLFWFNDGIVDDKSRQKRKVAKLIYYRVEGKWEMSCLVGGDMVPLDSDQRRLLAELGALYIDDPLSAVDSVPFENTTNSAMNGVLGAR